MTDTTFNTAAGATVDRSLQILYLNTGTDAAPVWSPVGKRVEDSSMEYDWGENSKTDIFGNTYTTLKKPTIKQKFDPCELDSGDVAQVKIWNMSVREHNTSGLCNQDMLIAHLYAGSSSTGAFAERYKSCSVKPSSLGGSSTIGMPIDVTYGGEREIGTVAITDGKPVFTKDAA